MRVGGIESDSERTFDGLASTEIEFAIKQLQTYGYFILSQVLEESKCAELERIALEADCILIDAFPNYSSEKFCSSDPIAVRYEVNENDLIQSEVVQQIVCDKSLYEIARQYLGSEPVQDLVAMWWTTSINTYASSAAAQQFHFDLDRLRFLKLFIYNEYIMNK